MTVSGESGDSWRAVRMAEIAWSGPLSRKPMVFVFLAFGRRPRLSKAGKLQFSKVTDSKWAPSVKYERSCDTDRQRPFRVRPGVGESSVSYLSGEIVRD